MFDDEYPKSLFESSRITFTNYRATVLTLLLRGINPLASTYRIGLKPFLKCSAYFR